MKSRGTERGHAHGTIVAGRRWSTARDLFSFAAVELRTLRRSVGAWVFAGLSCVVGTGLFVLAAGLHGMHSAQFPAFGFLAPQFFLSQFGVHLLFAAMLGTAFLAVGRADGAREDVPDVLGVRAFSNVALVGGRVLALAVAGWVSVFLVLGLLQGGSSVARWLGWWPGDSPAVASVATFLLIDLPPTLGLWCSGLVAMGALVRNRLLKALLALLAAAVLWGALGVPGQVAHALIPVMAYERLVSDIAPRWVDAHTALQRSALLLSACGLTAVAAALHVRRDGRSRGARTCLGGGLLAVGAACIGFLAWQATAVERDRERWRAAHQRAALDARSQVDLDRLSGRVRIDPGVELEIDVELAVRTRRDSRSLVLRLNPGMRVGALEVDGVPARFVHENGVLAVEPEQPVVGSVKTVVSVRAVGVPDPSFAYLDSTADDWRASGANRLRLAGSEAAIFEASYVGLLPGVGWLPTGVVAGETRDFFEVDLLVAVPAGWSVAGPGRARDAADPLGTAFRFSPGAPVDEVAVFAAAFERRTLDAAGTEVALLVHPRHWGNVELFQDVGDTVEAYLEEHLREVERLGVPYPYDGLTLVEVPSPLRGYRGGPHLPTALDLPGIVPIPETTFPTARFEWLLDGIAQAFRTNPDYARHAKAGHLLTYAREAGMVRRFARNLFGTTTGASGEDAAVLQRIGLDLADGLLPRPRAAQVNSVRAMDRDASPGELLELVAALGDGPRAAGPAYTRSYRTDADRPAVWDLVEGGRAAQDPVEPELALGALALRASAVARSILDSDRGRGASLIGLLRRRYSADTFDAGEFSATSVESGVDLAAAEWRMGTSLPGFVASDARIGRLEDGPDGGRRYQARLYVRNTQSVAGRVSVSADRFGWMDPSKPVPIGAGASVEIEWIGSEPPQALWLHSYLSLNRHPVPIMASKGGDVERRVIGGPFGVRPSDWLPENAGDVVVDDLDAGFSVGTQPVDRWSGSPVDREEVDLDGGLPVYVRFVMPMAGNRWYREAVPSAWGRYRRTVAIAKGGDGERSALFATELPRKGRWRLDYHIPPVSPPSFPDGAPRLKHISWLGGYDMAVRTGGREVPVEFDGRAAQPGWNELGIFEIDSGRVDVVVTNRTDGEIVVADAVRWREMRQVAVSRQ